MPFICYTAKRFNPKCEDKIRKANEILAEYAPLGLDLTLRQLYYQFVARDFIPNTFREYKNLQTLISNARLAGRIDWDSITDRTRNLQEYPDSWNGSDAIRKAAKFYREPKWDAQPNHVEVWVEKDALIGVIEKACEMYSLPHFSCRGYTSQSEVWASAMRLADLQYEGNQKPAIILHLGDHDPSGVDMSRDIADRMELFEAYNVTVKRIGLTMEQIKERKPPPNPAKMTDSRAKEYVKKYGTKSWELDSLDPRYLIDLIHKETEALLDPVKWKASLKQEARDKTNLELLSTNFDVASRFVGNPPMMQIYDRMEDDGLFDDDRETFDR